MGKVGDTPHVEASLVAGANTSVATSGGAPPLVERIRLAQGNMDFVQKLLCFKELAEQGRSKP